MKLPSILGLLIVASLVLFASPAKAADPAFPGQPHLNAALKHLNAAKEKASTDAPGAITDLQAANETLAHAIKNKGTYQNIAREYIAHATEYLKKGDGEKATHNIDEAIAAVNHAGSTGTH